MLDAHRQRAIAETRRFATDPGRRVQARNRLLAPWWRRRFAHFGAGAMLDRPLWLYGTKLISIGDNALILPGAWLSVERMAWTATEPVLRIGDGVIMRQHTTISASLSITIEDFVTFGGFCTVLDSSHTHASEESHLRPGPHESVINQPSETEAARIGRGTWLGDRVTVLMGARIGAHCTIGSNSVVRGEIPDYSIAAGSPARVIGTTRTQ